MLSDNPAGCLAGKERDHVPGVGASDTVLFIMRRRVRVRVFDLDGNEVDSYIDEGSDAQPEPEPDTNFRASPQKGGMLTLDQLTEYLAVSIRTIHRLVSDGQVPYLRVRSEVRFDLPDVLNALQRGGPRAPEEKEQQPRPTPGPLQENPKGAALLGSSEDALWNGVPQDVGIHEQGAGDHGVSQGTRAGPRRIAILRPRSEGE